MSATFSRSTIEVFTVESVHDSTFRLITRPTVVSRLFSAHSPHCRDRKLICVYSEVFVLILLLYEEFEGYTPQSHRQE